MTKPADLRAGGYTFKQEVPQPNYDVRFGGKADMTFCGAHVCF
jgi:hypothetical protein